MKIFKKLVLMNTETSSVEILDFRFLLSIKEKKSVVEIYQKSVKSLHKCTQKPALVKVSSLSLLCFNERKKPVWVQVYQKKCDANTYFIILRFSAE